MLTIDREICDAIVAHARRDHPDEACGIVAGPVDSDRPVRFIPMQNAVRSMTGYEFDSMEHYWVDKEIDDRGEDYVVIYHSHTATEPYPSRTDIVRASWPQAHYVIVSTRDPDIAEFRSFRIADGTVTEEPVQVTEPAGPVAAGDPAPVQSYMFGHTPTSVVYDCSGEAASGPSGQR